MFWVKVERRKISARNWRSTHLYSKNKELSNTTCLMLNYYIIEFLLLTTGLYLCWLLSGVTQVFLSVYSNVLGMISCHLLYLHCSHIVWSLLVSGAAEQLNPGTEPSRRTGGEGQSGNRVVINTICQQGSKRRRYKLNYKTCWQVSILWAQWVSEPRDHWLNPLFGSETCSRLCVSRFYCRAFPKQGLDLISALVMLREGLFHS